MNELTQEKARQLFIDLIIKVLRDQPIRSMLYMLSKSQSGLKDSKEEQELNKWFQNLDKASQENISKILEETLDSSLFGLCTMLDGVQGNLPIEAEISEFALYLKTYNNEKDFESDTANVSIKLNPADAIDDLHDMFRWTVEDQGKESKDF
jgi:hypothetical protein